MADIAAPQPTAAELAQNLAQLKERRTTLEDQRTATFVQHEQARADLITGVPDAVERATSAHARWLTLSEACDALDQQIAALRPTLAAAQREELRAALAAQLVPLAARAQAHRERVMEIHDQANTALQGYVAQVVAGVDALIACRHEFVGLIREVAPVNAGNPQYWSAEQRAALADGEAALAAARAQGAELGELLKQRVGTAMTPFDQQGSPLPSPQPYGWALGQMVGKVMQQREQQK